MPKTKSALTSSDSANCFGIPQDRAEKIEPGLDIELISSDKATEGPVELQLTDNADRMLGFIQFRFRPRGSNTIFLIESVVSPDCEPIEEYMPLDGDTQNVMQNWEELCVRLEDRYYSLQLGWEEDLTEIAATFDELSAFSDPSLSRCQEAVSGIPGSD